MSVILVGASPEKIKSCKAHSHPHWEIVIPILGEGVVEVGGEKTSFSEGMAYCIPPNAEHYVHSAEGFCDIFIHTESLMLRTDRITAVRSVGSFVPLGELMLSAYLKKEQGWRGTMESCFGLITQLIYDLTAESQGNTLAMSMRDFIIHNISNPSVSMEEMAAHFGYNSDYLRRVFKAEYGLTPMEFVWDSRLQRASELLINLPQYSIEEISGLCGFTDRFYFSRFFKKHKGVSPKQYRSR